MQEARPVFKVGQRHGNFGKPKRQAHIAAPARIQITAHDVERLHAHILNQAELARFGPLGEMLGQGAVIKELGVVVLAAGGCFGEIKAQADMDALAFAALLVVEADMGLHFQCIEGKDMGVVGHDCSDDETAIYGKPMTEPTITCINGRFLPSARATVTVADRGFRFGDGVFETIRLEQGVPYQWETHMERLALGLAAIGIREELPLAAMARKTLKRNAAKEGFLRIAVSRGVGSRGYLPFPPDMPATFVIEYLPPLPALELPLTLWLSSWAKIPPQCLPGKFKLAQGMNSILAMQEAVAHGCHDALQLTPSGMLSEAGSANLFWIQGGILHTPSLETGCLGGTTRDAVLRLSPLPVKIAQAPLSALGGADMVFVSNARLGIHPVAQVLPNSWQFATRHPDFLMLQQALADDRARYRKRHAKEWA